MKRLLPVILICLTAGALRAQQIPFYSQYYFNPFIYNSAYTGTNGDTRAFLTHRNQWTQIQGGPTTTMFTIDGPIQGEKAGLGLNFYSDRTDILSKSGAKLSYSYGVKVNDDLFIKGGLGVGVLTNKIDYSNVIVEDEGDPGYFSTSQNRADIDADFGIAAFWKGLNVGIAFPQLLGNSIKYSKLDNDETIIYKVRNQYIISAGYDWDIDDQWSLGGVVFNRITPKSPYQFDINIVGSYQKLGWLGLVYRHGYTLGLMAGAKLNDRLMLGLSYDLVILNDLAGYTGSSSEFLVGYTFGSSSKEKEEEARRREALRNELDSLKNKLKTTADQTDLNTKAIDSLGNEIQKVNQEVDKAIEELKKNPPTGGGAAAATTAPAGGNADEDIFSSDYLDNKGEPLKKGFYIVVGSYSEQKWARQAKLKFINAGFPETDVLYNITNKFYNVFLSFTTDEEEARKNLKNARAEYPDSWLRRIQ